MKITVQDTGMIQESDQAMNDIMQTIDLLRDVYIRETEALDKADADTFMALQGEKVQKAGDYQRGIQTILSRKEEMRKADPALKQKLHAMQADFAELGRKNMEALQRMKKSTERLGETIRSAARETARKSSIFSYGENGVVNSTSRKPISTGISETA